MRWWDQLVLVGGLTLVVSAPAIGRLVAALYLYWARG